MTTFPTNKGHVSYSEVRNWKECPFRHKLLYIEKIQTFDESPYLDYGTIVHEACEHFLKTKELILEETEVALRAAWEKKGFDSPEFISKMTARADSQGWRYRHNYIDDWVSWANNCITDLPKFMDKEFPGWETVAAEYPLMEQVYRDDSLLYKGYIDAIIKARDKKGNLKCYIIDWKTANARGWNSDKKRAFLTQAQIALYKNYWSRKLNVDPKDVHCGFVLLKRGGKPGRTCEFIKVSVGPKMQEKADKLVSNMISTVRRGFFPKNRGDACKFCDFKDTPHCPSDAF